MKVSTATLLLIVLGLTQVLSLAVEDSGLDDEVRKLEFLSSSKSAKTSKTSKTGKSKSSKSAAPATKSPPPSAVPSIAPTVEDSEPPSAASIGEFMVGGEDLLPLSADQASTQIEWLKGDVNEQLIYQEDVFSQNECKKLMNFIDRHSERAATTCTDCSLCSRQVSVDTRHEVKFGITAAELNLVVGASGLKALRKFFSSHTNQAPVTNISLRRLQANNQYVPYHLDVHSYILQVPLNGEEEYTGGKLVLLNANGTDYPPRPAGSATLHDASRLVHGVTRLTSGFRYGLYLYNDPTLPQECVLTKELLHSDTQGTSAGGNVTEFQEYQQRGTTATVGGSLGRTVGLAGSQSVSLEAFE